MRGRQHSRILADGLV